MATIKINMYNPETDELEEKEFVFSKNGITAFQYQRDANRISHNNSNPFDAMIELAVLYFPKVFGKEQFKIEGLDDKLKFSEVIEEYFINDPHALEELVNEMGLRLNPSYKKRM